MNTTESLTDKLVPDNIARTVVLPEGHQDHGVLFEAYRWLRENNPLARVEVEGYDPIWLVSKHADIMEIERQPAIFSSGGISDKGSNSPILHAKEREQFTKDRNGGSARVMDSLIYMDPLEHTMVKDIATEWFRPANLQKKEDSIRALAREILDKSLVPGVNDLDIVKDFAADYPLHVVMTLFGIPAEDEAHMLALSQQYFGGLDPDMARAGVAPPTPTAAAEQFLAVLADFHAYFDVVIENRRAEPKDDLATIIATARQPDGEYFPKSFAYGWFFALANGGHDTTSATLSGILEALAHHPDQLAAVQADLSKIPDLVNEGLRWASPAKHFVRRAEQDYVLRGREIRKGDRAMLLYQSGNRDADVFDSPGEFRFDRRPNKQIAFGYGPHMCIGQHVAKIELRIMLEELLPRIRSLEVTGERKLVLTNFTGGLRSLPMRIVLA